MIDRLLKFEGWLARVEAWLLVVLVILMLVLAVYNVFYRNVLVPLQVAATTPEAEVATTTDTATTPDEATTKGVAPDEAPPAEDGAGGFGGGFGEAPSGDEAEGFAGGFGESAGESSEGFAGGSGEAGEGEDAPDPAAGFGGDFEDPPAEDDARGEAQEGPPGGGADESGAGFGGDFADAPKTGDAAQGFGGDFAEEPEGAEDAAAGFGGGFGDEDTEPTSEPTPSDVESEQTAPARELSAFESFVDTAVKAAKLEWIDVVLRQLVLIVGFLGAMLATRRRKHITVDALSKVLSARIMEWVDVVTNGLSVVICILLASAGLDLVKLSLEFPKELVAWADEWTFQLAFPLGFGLLALHFAIRLIEAVARATTGRGRDEVEPVTLSAGGEA